VTFNKRKYRSKLESLVGSLLGPLWDYEPFQVPYVTYRNYTPDFVFTNPEDDFQTLVEVKGFFRVGDTQKYKAIRDALGPNQEFVFFLHSPRTKVRKGGKLNMGEWWTKEGFRWFDAVEDLLTYNKGLE